MAVLIGMMRCWCAGDRLRLSTRSIYVRYTHAYVSFFPPSLWSVCRSKYICLFRVIFRVTFAKVISEFGGPKSGHRDSFRCIDGSYCSAGMASCQPTERNEDGMNDKKWEAMKWWRSGTNENSCSNCAIILHRLFSIELWCRVAHMHVLFYQRWVFDLMSFFFLDRNKNAFFFTNERQKNGVAVTWIDRTERPQQKAYGQNYFWIFYLDGRRE